MSKVEAVFPRLDKHAVIEEMRRLEAEAGDAGTPAKTGKPAAAAGKHPRPATMPASAPPALSSGNSQAAGNAHPGTASSTLPSSAASTPRVSEASARISIEDFARVDMRVGCIQAAERVKGADKLLRLTVDIGAEVRQVVAGIAQAYAPEALIGRKVVIVANLAPRKLRGLESNGMVVAATVGENGSPVLVSVPDDVPNGSRLR